MDPLMPCEEARRAVVWYLDDELEPEHTGELEVHLRQCAPCRSYLERQSALRATLQRACRQVTCPAKLRRDISRLVAAERRRYRFASRVWPAAAAAAVLLALIWKGSLGGAGPELEEVAQRHARNLPMDVVAGDVTQVQSYFDGKLPFAVRLPRLQGQRVDSLGGRITRLRDRDAAYVRYNMPRGRLSVFVYDGPASAERMAEVAPQFVFGKHRMMLQQVRGFTVARWRSSGLVYYVVSDLPAREFANVMQAAVP